MTLQTSYILASRHFLCNELPTDWQHLSDDEIDDFFETNKCEDMLDYSSEYIWECIASLAEDFKSISLK